MTTVLIIAAILCILEFIVVTVMAVLQLFPKKEEKPINKCPCPKIILQFKSEDGCIYTLYNDFTWDVDTEY